MQDEKKDKLKVMVLMGGKTPEHAVSLVSGREVVRHLDKKKYKILPVVISPDGKKWELKSVSQILKLSPGGVGKSLLPKKTTKISSSLGKKTLIPSLKITQPDVIFLAMHGPFGEDGTIQGMLELTGIRYTGAGVLASALGMDKIMFRKVLEREKILIPPYLVLEKKGLKPEILEKVKLPVVVKPFDQGSSVGVSLVVKKSQLKKALNLAFRYSPKILVDEYIKGIEVSCGVLGNEKPYALPVIEIVPKGKFFDYEAKYQKGKCEEVVPARISKKLTQKVQELAVRVYRSIGCRGFGRVDMIIKNNKIYVLEINTLPGLTSNSLLPKEARAAGILYPQLLEKIIELALES